MKKQLLMLQKLRIRLAWALLVLALLLLPALLHAQIVVYPGPGGGGGAGNVIVSGTPTAGQIAAWTDPTHIQGISSMGILYDGAHVATAGAIATSVEYVTTGGPGVTRTLPAAASGTALRQFVVIKEDSGAGALTVSRAGSDTLNGPSGTALTSVSTTTQWAGWVIRELTATSWHVTEVNLDSGCGSAFTSNVSVSNAAPSLTLTDTTVTAKSLTLAVDANAAQLREASAAPTSLLNFDLTSNRVGIGVAPGTFPLEVAGDIGPEADSTRSLGASTKRYSILYTRNISSAGQTLIITSTAGSVNMALSNNVWLILGGGEASTPTAVGLRGNLAAGTNVNATNLPIQATLGTGTGTMGTLIFKAAATLQASGTTVHTAVDHMTIGAGKIILNSGAVTPAATGQRYLCIDTAGQVVSSASACSGT